MFMSISVLSRSRSFGGYIDYVQGSGGNVCLGVQSSKRCSILVIKFTFVSVSSSGAAGLAECRPQVEVPVLPCAIPTKLVLETSLSTRKWRTVNSGCCTRGVSGVVSAQSLSCWLRRQCPSLVIVVSFLRLRGSVLSGQADIRLQHHHRRSKATAI
jgi:hypothetical protein